MMAATIKFFRLKHKFQWSRCGKLLLLLTFLASLFYLILGLFSLGQSPPILHIIPKIFLKPPGVIARFDSSFHYGIGNQLFRYACCYSLAKHLKVPLYLQLSSADIPSNETLQGQMGLFQNTSSREFALSLFHIPLTNVIRGDSYLAKDAWEFTDMDLVGHRDELPKQNFLLHNDYCQSETFFKEYESDLRAMFQLKDLGGNSSEWEGMIGAVGACSVAVHVRRGDYKYHGWTTPLEWYKGAMRLMVQKRKCLKLTFFVFSDSIQEVRGNFTDMESKDFNILFVSSKNTTSLQEFHLMTKCWHMIASNSTFSWWAAYLIRNLGKIIIAPNFSKKFFNHYSNPATKQFKKMVIKELWYLPDWIVLDPQHFSH